MTTQAVYRIRVAVPSPLYQSFDYQIEADDFARAQIGARVMVPFGSQQLVAIITDKFSPDDIIETTFKLKPIIQLLDEHNIFGDEVFNLLQWVAQYYQYPLGETFHIGLPALLRQGKPADIIWHHWRALAPEQFTAKLTDKQQQAYQIVNLHQHGSSEDILNASGVSTATLQQLLNKNAVVCSVEQPTTSSPSVQLAQLPLTPNVEQRNAIEQILEHQQHYHGFLLDGLTGSGKTEVYLQVIHEVLKQGRQVLVLVPEIGLTPQTIARFQSRFNTPMAVLHSGLNDSKRLQAWQQAKSGRVSIVLGTRSAIFTPFKNLGLIILDEEHDLSYKQQDSLRYHARDVALYRAYQQNCPIILGSATPSIESYYLVEQQKLSVLQLDQRAGVASLPQLHTIDLTTQKKKYGLSELLIDKIKHTLKQGEQVLLFLNRRGYAPVLFCENCAWQADCPRCDAHFTVHNQPYQHLRCHHCSLVYTLPQQCPKCQSPHLKPLGMGTSQMEQHLQVLFKDYPIVRIDRDSTHKADSWDKFYQQIQENKPLILIGTQMLSKGHHFPYVTLVGILDVDAGFFSVDFRASERTAQQIIQVAGRAGRIHKKGEVYLQTYRPQHPMLDILLKENYRSFALHSLAERKSAHYPPYSYAALVRASSKNEQYNLEFLQQAIALLPQNSGLVINILGPTPAPMSKKAGYYQAHILLMSLHRREFHQQLKIWWQDVLKLNAKKQFSLRLSLDIDPQELG